MSARIGDPVYDTGCPRGSRTPGVLVFYASAALQNSTHFFVSFTASEPSGMAYSSSIEAGNFQRFFRTAAGFP